MTRLMASLGFFLTLAVLAPAQDRSGAHDERDDRLALYLRTGRYADARRLIDDMLKTEPRDDLKNVRAVFGSGPNMGVRHAAASFTCEVTDTGVVLPLTVNGKPVNWLLDTGANVTLVSDAEAARLGLVIRDSAGRAADHAGGSTGVRTAIARRLVIGRTQLENVPFLLTPADQMPWKELPPGKQGIIGLPIAIALDALRWTRSGTCHTGSTAVATPPPASPNLTYEGLHIVTKVDVQGRMLDFLLDTGNQAGTQLWERFGKDFESLVKERGRKGSARVTQIGGASDRDIIVIPGMQLKVGGKDTTLAEGKLFSRPVGDDRFHGLLGMDVLSQATEVTIDFRSMTLTLRSPDLPTCVPIAQRVREVGCWIIVDEPVGRVSSDQVFWHLDTFPTRAAAEAAKRPGAVVVEALGKIWLMTIATADFRPGSGEHVAQIGPLPVSAAIEYSATYMEAVFTPGMESSTHTHSGPEAWYTMTGETCLETPEGIMVGRAGGPPVIVPAGPPMHLTATGTSTRRAVVLILHDRTQPPTTVTHAWTPKGLCQARTPR